MTLPPNVLRPPDPEDWEQLGPGVPALEARFTTGVARLHALGLKHLGAHLERLPPGTASCPLHHHVGMEEHVLVLRGTLTVRELRPGEVDAVTFQVPAGELVAWPANTGIAHQISNDTDLPVDLLVVSDRPEADLVYYPDSDKFLGQGLQGVGALHGGDLAAQFTEAARQSAARTTRPGSVPAHVTSPETVPERSLGDTCGRPLSRSAGAERVFVNVDRLPPGTASSPLHSHSANEELVLVLDGTPTLRQLREGTEERATLAPGDVVFHGASDGVAHHLLNESDADVRLAVVGTDHPADVLTLPDQGVLHVPAFGRSGVFETTSYWAGEGA